MSNYIEYIKAGSGEAWPIRDAEALHKSGGTMAENIDMGGHKIAGLNAPTDGQDAANKKYVDDQMEEWKNDNPLNFAPSGFGLGETTPAEISTTEQLDACRACGFYRYKISGSNICGISFAYSSLIVYSLGPNSCTQELRPINTNHCLRRYYYHETWSEWELVGVVLKLVWENASLTSDFAAQKISLTLSSGDAVYVEAIRSTDDNTISGRTIVYVGGSSGYLMGGTDQFALTRRKVTASTTGVTFTAYSSANTTSGTSNEIPYRIYVVRGISK